MRTRNSFEWNKNYPFTWISSEFFGQEKGEGGRSGDEDHGGDPKRKNPAETPAVKAERVSRNSVFNINLRPRSLLQNANERTNAAPARARRIKLGILRKETRPHIRRIVIRPLHSLPRPRRFAPPSPSSLRPFSTSPPGVSWFLPRNAPSCRGYFTLLWGLHLGTEGEKERESENVVGKISFSPLPSSPPKRFPPVPFRGMRKRENRGGGLEYGGLEENGGRDKRSS